MLWKNDQWEFDWSVDKGIGTTYLCKLYVFDYKYKTIQVIHPALIEHLLSPKHCLKQCIFIIFFTLQGSVVPAATHLKPNLSFAPSDCKSPDVSVLRFVHLKNSNKK